MEDILNIIKNVEEIYDNNTSFQVLKDFERVLDELDIYVFKNWEDGELAAGPKIERHWVTCSFFWPRKRMPDPMGAKRLLDYDCKVKYKKTAILQPRKIREPGDIRPGTKKGKMDSKPIWIVEIQMPKKLITDIYSGYLELSIPETAEEEDAVPATQPADDLSSGAGPDLGTGTNLEPGSDLEL
jgi:hypothetical protein